VPPYTDRDLEERLLTWDLIQPGMFETMIEKRSVKIRERAEQFFGRSIDEVDALFSWVGVIFHAKWPKPNKPVTKGNKKLMGSKTWELKEFSEHTFHPLEFERY
jgi:hypothetical protein